MDDAGGVVDVLSGSANVDRVIGLPRPIRGAELNNFYTAAYDHTTESPAPFIKTKYKSLG
jgi:hypothetical protein